MPSPALVARRAAHLDGVAEASLRLPLPSDVLLSHDDHQYVRTATVFCSSPDARSRDAFVALLRRKRWYVTQSVMEHWLDNMAPRIRMEVCSRLPCE